MSPEGLKRYEEVCKREPTRNNPEEYWRWLRELCWESKDRRCWICALKFDLSEMELHHLVEPDIPYFQPYGRWETEHDVALFCKPCHEMATSLRRKIRYSKTGLKTPTPYKRSSLAIGTSMKHNDLGGDDLQGCDGSTASKIRQETKPPNSFDETQDGYRRKTPERGSVSVDV